MSWGEGGGGGREEKEEEGGKGKREEEMVYADTSDSQVESANLCHGPQHPVRLQHWPNVLSHIVPRLPHRLTSHHGEAVVIWRKARVGKRR